MGVFNFFANSALQKEFAKINVYLQMFLSSVACQNSIGTTWKHGVLGSIKKVRISTRFPTLLLTASDENVFFLLLNF